MTTLRLVAAAMLSAASFCAGAQSLKPGLWEITNQMRGGGAEMEQGMARMQQELANMSPEQRKTVQDMMAKQGVGADAGGMGGRALKVCLTKEMVARNEIPAQLEGNCKRESSSRSGNTMSMSFTCANPPSSGQGTVTFVSPEAYSTRMTVQATVRGKSEKMDMAGSGRWVSADCGSVKPAGGK
jgi:uncharacterized protein DUF3617